MAAYLELIHLAARAFDKISISQRPRNDIRHADALAYLSSAIEMDSSRTIIVDYQKDPSINVPVRWLTRKRKRDITSVAPDNVVDHDLLHISAPAPDIDSSDDSDHEGDDSPEVPDIEIVLPEVDFLDEDWRIPFIQFLKSGILPTEPLVLARVKRDAWLYTVVDTSEELLYPTSWSTAVDLQLNDDVLEKDKALIDETRDEALQHLVKYQGTMKRNYDKKVRLRSFKPGDWVLRRVTRLQEQGKLGENWDGPFIIERLASKGAYFLRSLGGDLLDKPWSGYHLRKFYR
ncbi:Gypsy retrotransposon integrase-like protein [Thalictrum thalictroides]|uniref:Gypsy retrotransposon integrase-like protein n=1 Tax=Thalictrum thalictroides TaxID=46969 RepID=A0A7J6WXN2_THATH|nr:Gypsy retrotransposon integrase-like protein [Thalictrum thalictroides]